MIQNEAQIKQAEVDNYDAVIASLQSLPHGAQIIAENFLDKDLPTAFGRFRESPEWAMVRAELAPQPGEWVADYGAGRCIASAAFAELGCNVVALEMNPSPIVGLGVLTTHSFFGDLPTLHGVLADAEHAPFPSATFDVVYCREALHHAFDLEMLVGQLVALLKPGGRFLAYGEHRHPFWSSDDTFRVQHPAAKFGVNEHSYPTIHYVRVLKQAGLEEVRALPVMSPIFAAENGPIYHRLMCNIRSISTLGDRLFHLYHRAQLYRTVGSQITLVGRKAR